MLTIEEVRRIYSVRSVLGISDRTKKVVCPLPQHAHSSYTPSCSIFRGRDGVERFECHGNCNLSGDVIDLIGYMQLPDYEPNNPTSVSEAINLLTSGYSITMPTKPPAEKFLAPNAWRKYYPPGPDAVDYARSRGIERKTLGYFKVGEHKKFLAMPTFEDGILKAIKFRNMTNVGLRFYAETGSVGSMFNHDSVVYQTEPLLIVKGEIPCMVLWERGIHCCALTGGEAMHIETWLPKLALAKIRVLVGDNDRDPRIRDRMQSYTKQSAEALRANVAFPPEEFKDIDDWVLADPNAIDTIKGWLL